MTKTMLVLGAGFSGLAIARLAQSSGMAVSGTTRTQDGAARLAAAGIPPVIFDGATTNPGLDAALAAATHLVMSIAPGETGDPALGVLSSQLAAAPNLRWIGYLSTIGVYGDHGGQWVDEKTPVTPHSRRSIERAKAEADWQDFAETRKLPLAILRLSGIYGPGRNTLANLAAGKARTVIKPGQVFNRVHVDDVAGALLMLARSETGGVYNVTDDEPAPPQDVVAFAASLMGIAPPPPVAIEDAGLSPMGLSFYGENKRVANAAIKAAGYRFAHPDYRGALADLWNSGAWRG